MAARDVGKAFIAISATTFLYLLVRLGLLVRSYSVGFDVLAMVRIWRAWLLLWLVVTVTGLVLFNVKQT